MSATYLDDMLLVERYRNGDRDAVDRLIVRYNAHAYRYATRLQSSRDIAAVIDAGDIVAETFVRVHRSLGRFDGRCAFSTWLYRIVKNTYIDLVKRQCARPNVFSYDSTWPMAETDLQHEFEDQGPSPFESMEQDALTADLRNLVNKLPEHQRDLIVQFYHESLSCEEISEALGVPVGTIKSRLHRARLALRTSLTTDLNWAQFA